MNDKDLVAGAGPWTEDPGDDKTLEEVNPGGSGGGGT